MVILQIATPTGVQMFFLPVDVAKKVAEIVGNAAAAAGSGIIVAPANAKL
jgi:hypothetical protein